MPKILSMLERGQYFFCAQHLNGILGEFEQNAFHFFISVEINRNSLFSKNNFIFCSKKFISYQLKLMGVIIFVNMCFQIVNLCYPFLERDDWL